MDIFSFDELAIVRRRPRPSWYDIAKNLLIRSEDPNVKYSKIISKIERFFGIKMKVKFKKNSSMWGEIRDDNTIYVGANLSVKNTILVLVHEAIHRAWDLPHNPLTRRVNFRSYGKKDYFSELFARLIFREDLDTHSKNMQRMWPYYFEDRATKIRFYVDMPNELIEDFIDDVKKRLAAGEDLKQLCDEYNQMLKEEYNGIDWLEFKAPTNTRSMRPLIHIHWDRFMNFLEEFAKAEKNLPDKYEYLNNARSVISHIRKVKRQERVADRVRQLVRRDIDHVRDEVDCFVDHLKCFSKDLDEFALSHLPKPEDEEHPPENIYPTTLLYLYQLEYDIGQISMLVESGLIRQAYSALRSVLENLCLVVADDILVYNTSALWDEKNSRAALEMFIVNPPPFSTSDMYATKLYHDLCEEHHYKVYWLELRGTLNSIVKNVESLKSLLKNLSYPLLITLHALTKNKAAKSVVNYGERIDLYLYDAEKIIEFASLDIKKMNIDDESKSILLSHIRKALKEFNKIAPPYLTPTFTTSYIDFVFSEEAQLNSKWVSDLYDRFSYFVHPYYSTWNYFAFSSVLEFKIFREEFKMFKLNVMRILDDYFEMLRQIVDKNRMIQPVT